MLVGVDFLHCVRERTSISVSLTDYQSPAPIAPKGPTAQKWSCGEGLRELDIPVMIREPLIKSWGVFYPQMNADERRF
jgi:hypothetical protein